MDCHRMAGFLLKMFLRSDSSTLLITLLSLKWTAYDNEKLTRNH